MKQAHVWIVGGLCVVTAAAMLALTVWLMRLEGPREADAAPRLSGRERQRLALLDPSYQGEAIQMARQLHEERRTLAELMEDEQSTDMAILEQVERVIAAHNALERRVAEHWVAMRHELEPTQREELTRYTAGQVRRGLGPRWAEEGNTDRPRRGRGMNEGMEHGRGTGRGMGRSGGGEGGIHDTIMFLFEHHDRIERQVRDLADGVETITVSDDAQVVEALRQHVWQMKQRMESGQPMRRGDPLFRELFDRHRQVEMEIEEIESGVKVRQRSDDPQVVLLLRQHAHAAVSEFVEMGLERMHQPTPLPQGYRRR